MINVAFSVSAASSSAMSTHIGGQIDASAFWVGIKEDAAAAITKSMPNSFEFITYYEGDMLLLILLH